MARPTIIYAVDDREVQRALDAHDMSVDDMLAIEFPIAATIINKARIIVPKKTTATEKSIGQHIQIATKTRVLDYVGSETPYSKYIEFGVPSRPNYPIQPFMRPASLGNIPAITAAAIASVKLFLKKAGRLK